MQLEETAAGLQAEGCEPETPNERGCFSVRCRSRCSSARCRRFSAWGFPHSRSCQMQGSMFGAVRAVLLQSKANLNLKKCNIGEFLPRGTSGPFSFPSVLLTPLSCCSLAPEGSPAPLSRSPSSPCSVWWRSSRWCGGPGKRRVVSGAFRPPCQCRPGAPVELSLRTHEASKVKPNALIVWSTLNSPSLLKTKQVGQFYCTMVQVIIGIFISFSKMIVSTLT